MKDKEWNQKKNKIAKILRTWIKDFGLRWYNIDIEYKAGDAPERGNEYKCVAQVTSKWMYRDATITIWLEELPYHDEERLERLLVHELCHILVEQMRPEEGVTDNEECVVEGLARAFMWVREGNK